MDYQTADITGDFAAIEGTDYPADTGTVTLVPQVCKPDAPSCVNGEAVVSGPIDLNTTEDTLNEADEEFDLTFMKVTLP